MSYVIPRFNDDVLLLVGLYNSNANVSRKFIVAIINYELCDINDLMMKKLRTKNDKYLFKLKTLIKNMV